MLLVILFQALSTLIQVNIQRQNPYIWNCIRGLLTIQSVKWSVMFWNPGSLNFSFQQFLRLAIWLVISGFWLFLNIFCELVFLEFRLSEAELLNSMDIKDLGLQNSMRFHLDGEYKIYRTNENFLRKISRYDSYYITSNSNEWFSFKCFEWIWCCEMDFHQEKTDISKQIIKK